MTKILAYTGIGSRKTPEPVLKIMEHMAMVLAHHGWTLRSGGAGGADLAFETGCSMGPKQIFIPWGGFNNRSIHERGVYGKEMRYYHIAQDIAAKHHPTWHSLSPSIQAIMTRNTYQVFGPDLSAVSQFLLCWTPEGKGEGGTGQAIRIAKAHEVPVFDLGGMPLEEIEHGITEIVTTAAKEADYVA